MIMPITDQSPANVCVVFIALFAVLSLLTGCASTKVVISGQPLEESLCRAETPPISLQIYWTTQWRPEQKEPQMREVSALQGVQDFLAGAKCLSVVAFERLASGQALPSDADLLQLAASGDGYIDRIVLVVVRELGPRLVIGLPVIVEGGTEVLIDVRVLDPQEKRTLADSQTLWRNGGVFVVKGVKTLANDMSAALRATLIDRQGKR
jgi:hypothetical protein